MESLPMTPPATDGGPVEQFLEALTRGNYDALQDCLAPGVWFRALLPRKLHESNTAREAAEAYRAWYGEGHGCEALAAEHDTLTGRHFVRYRFRVLPSWAPASWHVIEQSGICRVKEGRISRLDVVCTGFHPLAESTAGGSPSRQPRLADFSA